MKRCAGCKENKPEDDFALVKDKRRKNNKVHVYIKNICKICEKYHLNAFRRNQRKKLKEETKTKARKQNIKYVEINKDALLGEHKNYPQFHKYISKLELKKLIVEFNDELFQLLKKFERAVKICKYNKNYRTKYRKELAQKNTIYYAANKERFAEQNKRYRDENAELLKKKGKVYRDKNKKKLRKRNNAYQKERWRKDPCYKLRMRISCQVRSTLFSKSNKSVLDYLPYSINQLKSHIESLFEPWMMWENWGKYEPNNWNDNDFSTWKWQLDHIIPQSKLIYDSVEHSNFLKCWALDNLRPYSAKQNLIDGSTRARHA